MDAAVLVDRLPEGTQKPVSTPRRERFCGWSKGVEPRKHPLKTPRKHPSWWTFRIFFFFCLGRGEGGVRGARRGGGVGFLLKIPGGGVSRRGKGFPGGLFGANWGIWGEGLNFFFGAETSTKPLKNTLKTPWKYRDNTLKIQWQHLENTLKYTETLLGLRAAPFAVPALSSLESVCRVSILWDAVTGPTVCFSGVLRGSPGGVSSSLRPKPSASICSEKRRKVKTKGRQLKGKSFHTFSRFFIIFPPGLAP